MSYESMWLNHMFVSVKNVRQLEQRMRNMKEHNLPEIAKLYLEMEEIHGRIKESRERAPDLVMAYLVEPFEAEDKAGKKSVHNSIDVGPSLGIAPGDIRAAAVIMIEDLLNNKIQEIKLKLKKLGVKLEEPPTPKPAKVLRLTDESVNRMRGANRKENQS